MDTGPKPPEWPPMGPMRMLGGLRSRVAVSIVVFIGWLIFLLLYAGFWSTGFTLFQSIVIVLVSFLVMAALLGAMWASWGMRFMR